TQKHGVLLICDEVMSGWGRTGEWFAVNHWNVKPDILTTAKGVTGAFVPLSVTATTREISDYFEEHYFAVGHTYEAHPLTLAAGVAGIQEYKRLGLIQRSRQQGEYLGQQLKALKEKHSSVGDVRGLGMFWGIELVRDRDTKAAFNTREEKIQGKTMMVDKVAAEAMKQGTYVVSWLNALIIAPPLIASQQEIDQGV